MTKGATFCSRPHIQADGRAGQRLIIRGALVGRNGNRQRARDPDRRAVAESQHGDGLGSGKTEAAVFGAALILLISPSSRGTLQLGIGHHPKCPGQAP